MPPLATTARPIVGLPHAALACHNASFYWLYHAAHGVAPTLDTITGRLSPTQVNMATMVRTLGSHLTQPMVGRLTLTPGSIIVFMRQGVAGHSCVATTAAQMSGYNQVGWFTTAGVAHGFSQHTVDDFNWDSGLHRSKVLVNNRHYDLYTVSEARAKQFVARL
jgi:hypothetical protein